MKKLLLIAFLLVGKAYAQSDTFAITLVSPAVGTTITNGVPQPFTYYAKNVSGQTLDSGTTFAINFGTRTAQGAFAAFSNQLISSVLTSPLADGDSVERTINFTLNMPAGTNNQSFICIAIYTLSGTSARFQVASCRQYNLFNNLSEIHAAAKTVKVYPNPAKSFINFEYEYNKASMITIYDITGKKVMQTNHDGINTQVDISALNNGLYLYDIRTSTSEVIKTGKFNIH